MTCMVQSDLRKKNGRSRQNSPTVGKVFENKFGQVVEKSFDFFLRLFGFVKATKFRDSSEFSDCVQNIDFCKK